ncbi:uncharacterized protein LOC141705844 [Apium graveolens]|uniref:uncharacterized protein LOC141705844 n=1 Tax=Apium graveolens TaxID=4045 RepID=UPI003D7ACB4A
MNYIEQSPKNKIKTMTSPGLKIFILITASVCIIYVSLSLFLVPDSKFLQFSVSLQDMIPSTSLEHIVFGIAATDKSWLNRKDYVRLWWKPQLMRGCVFLETKPPPNRTVNIDYENSLPPVCISRNTSQFRYTYRGGSRSVIRIARIVAETVALNHTNVRWFVFGDDDTMFFGENLVKVLSKYDHDLWYYIGSNSESHMQNTVFSFNMAFGGAGFAISYPLAKVLAKVLDSCIQRYAHLYGSDDRISACIAELGIGLTREVGFHQMDIRGDISGILTSHPLTPLISLHNLDVTNSIFPNMSNLKALEHLNKAVKHDPHRIIQQTVCYDRWFFWTVSVSWGYAVQVFGKHVQLSDSLRVQQTFEPFQKGNVLHTLFDINTRGHDKDACRRPLVFFMEKVSSTQGKIKSIYKQMNSDNCTRDMGSPRRLDEIRVSSQKFDLDNKQLLAPRRQCCDILPPTQRNVMEVAIRECRGEELIYMHP